MPTTRRGAKSPARKDVPRTKTQTENSKQKNVQTVIPKTVSQQTVHTTRSQGQGIIRSRRLSEKNTTPTASDEPTTLEQEKSYAVPSTRGTKRSVESNHADTEKKQKTSSTSKRTRNLKASNKQTGDANTQSMTKSHEIRLIKAIKSEPEFRVSPAVVSKQNTGIVKVKCESSSVTDMTAADLRPAEILSPRRSSRSVVPNSRYKDMIDPAKLKSVIKSEEEIEAVKFRQKKEKNTTPISAKRRSRHDDVTEEIVTEETRIDHIAQMNLMDDTLILPHSSESTTLISPESSHSAALNMPHSLVSTEDSVSQNSVTVMGDQANRSSFAGYSRNSSDTGQYFQSRNHGNFSMPLETIPSASIIDTRNSATDLKGPELEKHHDISSAVNSTDSSLFQMPETQVIIIPNGPGKEASKIVIQKDPYRARLEQAFEKSGSSVLFGSSTGRQRSKKLIISPTHQHVSKKDVQRPRTTSLGSQGNVTVHTQSLSDRWSQSKPVTSVAQLSDMSEKQQSFETNIDMQCHEVTLEIADNSTGTSTELNALESTTTPKGEQVKLIYLDEKSNQNNCSVQLPSNSDEDVQRVEIIDEHLLKNIDKAFCLLKQVENNQATDGSYVDKNQTLDQADENLAEQLTDSIVDQRDEILENSNSNATDEKLLIAGSVCQVVEYKRDQPHTAIEYVLLDNKMVPIHKPYNIGSHGRVRPPPSRPTPGRVVGGKKGQVYVKKMPGSIAKSHVGGLGSGQSTSITSSEAQESTTSATDVISEESRDSNGLPGYLYYLSRNKSPGRPGNVYYPSGSKSPTEIVEISSETFTKEVYGDNVNINPLTGEILNTTTSTGTAEWTMSEGEPVSNSLAVIGAENQPSATQPHLHSVENQYEKSEDENKSTDSSDQTASELVPGLNTGSAQSLASTQETSDVTSIPNPESQEIPSQTGEKSADLITQPQQDALKPKVTRVLRVDVKKRHSTDAGVIHKMTNVKITPVLAYNKNSKPSENDKNVQIQVIQSEKSARDSGESMVSKAIGTNMEESDEEIDDEEEEEGIILDEERAQQGRESGAQQYIVVHLPEGTEIKTLQARAKKDFTSLGEDVTVDSDGMYTCKDCDHKTENKGNWLKHRRKHLGIRPHPCPQCSYRAATSSNLKRHLQIHDDVRNFQCAYCSLLFRQKIHLERHLKYKHQEKNVKCPLCDYVCSTENPDLKIHIKRRHIPSEGNLNGFTCETCGLMTVSKKDLKQHLKFHKIGPELKLFCEHCSFVTDCVSRLRRHMLIHTKERPFQCGLCLYRASQKEHVLRHMRSQHGVDVERNQRRSLLEKNFHNPEEIIIAGPGDGSNPKRDQGDESDPGSLERNDYSSTDKIFACNYCSMKFSKLINLYKHLYAQHRQVMPQEGPNDFQCVVCDFRTNNKKNLLVHMRKHNMQDHTPPTHVYSCVLCRYINPRRRNLFQHMKKKHGIEILMKDDGLNCYVTLDGAAAQIQKDGGQVQQGTMLLSQFVTTQSVDESSQMEYNTSETSDADDSSSFPAERISIDNIIPVEEIEAYVVSNNSQELETISSHVASNSSFYPSVQEHEAAEAIEGLQALAEQPGIQETQNIDNDMSAEIVSSAIEVASASEIMNDGQILSSGEMLTAGESTHTVPSGEATEGFQLSTEQLNQLSSGDYVEINGELYKVEIAPEGSQQNI